MAAIAEDSDEDMFAMLDGEVKILVSSDDEEEPIQKEVSNPLNWQYISS